MKYAVGSMALLILTSISACAPAIKNEAMLIKEINIPHQLITSNRAVTSSQDYWRAEGWWNIFKNNQLNNLIKIALKENPGIAEAKSRLKIAQAEILQMNATQHPRVDAGAVITNAHYSDMGDHGVYNGETNTVGVIDPLIINYHPDFWGKDEVLVASTKANSEIFQAKLKESVITLRKSVIKTFFSLKITDEMVTTQLQLIELEKEIENVKYNALQAGLQPTTYILPSRQYIYQSKAYLAVIQQQRSALQYALSALLGNSPDNVIELAPEKLNVPEQVPLPSNINLDLISHRPDIQAALWNIRYTFHLEEVAQKEYYPNVNFRALLGLNSIGLSGLLRSGSLTYTAGPVLSLPIFDSGALKGKFEASAFAYDAAVFSYNKAILNAAKDVATSLANLGNTKSVFETQSLSLENSRTFAKITASEYRSGVSDKLSSLEANVNEKNSYIKYLQTQLAWLFAITDLATALDGELQGTQNDDKS